jgi:hypothetical protein
MKVKFIFLAVCLIIYNSGYSITTWTGKYQLAFDAVNTDVIYLQVVPDNTGNGSISPESVAYIYIPGNIGILSIANVTGSWEVKDLTEGWPGDSLAGSFCGKVIECQNLNRIPLTGNAITFTQGVPVNLVKITLTSSCPRFVFRLYENLGDPCEFWAEAGVENGLVVEVTGGYNTAAYTGNLTTYSNPLFCTNAACAWATISDGEWTSASIWKYMDCDTGGWVNSPVAPNNSAPIYVYHNVEIPSGTTITTSSIVNIEPSGKLKVLGTLNADNQIVFKISESGDPGELSNGSCTAGGTVNMGASSNIVVRKIFEPNKWAFISFPFDISETNIYHNGTAISSWGGPGGSGKNLYVAQYDGIARSAETGDLSTTIGKYFVSVPGTIGARILNAYQGYIMASGNKSATDSIDFIAATNTQFNFCTSVPISTTYTSGASPCNCGWNLVGTSFVASYDLTQATGLPNHYVHNGVTYSNVITTVNPFTAYFVHVEANGTFTYQTTGQIFAKGLYNLSPEKELILNYSSATYTDNTTIKLKENGLAGFNLIEDAVKIISSSVNVPQIYTEIPGACGKIAVNTLPSDTNRVNLIVRNGSVGTYTISMSEHSKVAGLKQAILVDSETGLRTDLLTSSYTYENIVPGTSSRFYVLFSNETTTEITQVGNSNISVSAIGKNIKLFGLTGPANVNMYDVVGKLIYQFTDITEGKSFNVSVPGVYIMDINSGLQHEKIKILIKNQ